MTLRPLHYCTHCAATQALWGLLNFIEQVLHNATPLTLFIDERIVLTGGYDGTVFLWDVVLGVKMATFQLQHALLSCQWHPSGDQFIISDLQGFVYLYGFACCSRNYVAPVEQFFGSDFVFVTEDADGI